MQNLNKNETGFSLIELLVVVIILGISAAVATPSLVGSFRQNQANQAFSQLVSALQTAQANANRLSLTCPVTVTNTQISSTTVGCLQETVTIDSTIINVNTSPTSTTAFTSTVNFNFNGEPVQSTAANAPVITSPINLFVARKNTSSVVDTSNANCVVISPGIGLIRTGKYDDPSDNDCQSIANLQYPN